MKTLVSGSRAACAAGALCLAVLAWEPARALAYSDPLMFADPVTMGGGGGRYFTGSAADGYGCDVCHSGGPSPPVLLVGLPLTGYQPATAYELRVEWPASVPNVALALEIVDSAGSMAGTLRLPPAAELPGPERCEPIEDGLPAGMLSELEGGRIILNVPDCGAERVRFLWTAPSASAGPLRLSGGLLASDVQADVAGDGTTMFSATLQPAGETEPRMVASAAACSAARSSPRGSGPSWTPWAGLLLAWRAVRRRAWRASAR